MTRRPDAAPDPHARFAEWLLAGPHGEIPRDLALHASVCAVCTARATAVDLLAAVDVGRAPAPPSRLQAGADRPAAGAGWRVAAGAAAVLVLGVSAGALALQNLPPLGVGEAAGTPTPDQEVLGAAGGATGTPTSTASSASESAPHATASPEPSSASPSVEAGEQPDDLPTPAPPTPARTAAPTTRVDPTAQPTVNPSATATTTATPTATPVPTATATPSSEPPTPEPTPVPTPEPTPEPTAPPTPEGSP